MKNPFKISLIITSICLILSFSAVIISMLCDWEWSTQLIIVCCAVICGILQGAVGERYDFYQMQIEHIKQFYELKKILDTCIIENGNIDNENKE